MEVLQKGLSKTLKENNRLIFKELRTMQKRADDKLQNMEERNQARHEIVVAATKLHKLEFVTRQEFEKLKKQIHRLQPN